MEEYDCKKTLILTGSVDAVRSEDIKLVSTLIEEYF